ncbi:MAG: peptide deformylase [Lentisphaerae bacterium]|nr:MAG: peptide deformylase [Lentisphaerota bacterium]
MPSKKDSASLIPYPLPEQPEPLPVSHYGAPELRRPSRAVERIDDTIRHFIACMIETMYAENGIGLAAPQVGVNLQIVTIHIPESMQTEHPSASFTPQDKIIYEQMPLALINPVISNPSTQTDIMEEGCLSLPGLAGNVRRSLTITIEYTDLDNVTHSYTCTGMLARCLQHEIDHLNATLYIDRMDPEERRRLEPKLRRLRKQTMKELRQRSY